MLNKENRYNKKIGSSDILTSDNMNESFMNVKGGRTDEGVEQAKSKTGMTAGITVAVIIVILLIAVIIVLVLKKNQKSSSSGISEISMAMSLKGIMSLNGRHLRLPVVFLLATLLMKKIILIICQMLMNHMKDLPQIKIN